MNKAMQVRLLLLVLVLVIAGCSQSEENAEGAPDSEAVTILDQAIRQAQAKERFAMTMKLGQNLSHNEGQSSEQFSMTSEGKVELEPLAVEQMIESGEGESPTQIETILTPDGYYVYDHTFDEGWRQYPQDEIATVTETLSDYQVNPVAQLERIKETVGGSLTVSEEDGMQILSYEGNGGDRESTALMNDLLDSTLNGSQLPQEVRDSVETEMLQYRIVMDGETGLPVEIWSQSTFSIAFEAGYPVDIDQTFEVSYRDWDATEPVTVPEEALNAPEIEMPSAEELEEWEEMERQLQEELERLREEEENGTAPENDASEAPEAETGVEQEPQEEPQR
ncbi:DUF6612 family protein [Paenibacillus daejeonensis]|uniref:DUF6612 family protein n=1 Tax=Paenibacillus daejeonensis TaxID=135193 RepID=UPI0003661AD5|nr:DUF6612 family protein [Paenibacillus daejeonensis]